MAMTRCDVRSPPRSRSVCPNAFNLPRPRSDEMATLASGDCGWIYLDRVHGRDHPVAARTRLADRDFHFQHACPRRSEEHTSELQSLMRISYAVFCLKKKPSHNSTVSPLVS